MLPFITEFLLGFLAVACALVWWQQDINLRRVRRDFEAVRTELLRAGILKKASAPNDRGEGSCPSSRNASGNGGHRSGRP